MTEISRELGINRQTIDLRSFHRDAIRLHRIELGGRPNQMAGI
ncbi:MAG: hypothetical protein OXU74_07665 [Gemmatimonadota bacterium]|nr:hypothetical protein [Gemmatimonadota bacterium]